MPHDILETIVGQRTLEDLVVFADVRHELPRMRKIATDASAVEDQIDLLLYAIERFNATGNSLHTFVVELAHAIEQ